MFFKGLGWGRSTGEEYPSACLGQGIGGKRCGCVIEISFSNWELAVAFNMSGLVFRPGSTEMPWIQNDGESGQRFRLVTCVADFLVVPRSYNGCFRVQRHLKVTGFGRDEATKLVVGVDDAAPFFECVRSHTKV